MGAHRIGLIGCGGIAGAWIRAVAEHDDCQIDWVYDLNDEAAATRAEEASAEVVADLAVGLSSEVDLVIIGTPTLSHPALVAQAAAAGRHVMCEKPMALSLDACRGMIEACTTAGVQLAIGHSLRFWGAFLQSRKLIDAGAIGTPVSGSIDRLGAAKARQEGTPGAWEDHWRQDPANTGGHALEGFIHELDFARAVFGDVAAVSCEIGLERPVGGGYVSPQIIQGLVTFANGAVVTTRTGSTVGVPTRGYWIAGSEGGLRFDGWGGPVQLYRRDAEGPEEVSCAEVYAYHLELKDLTDAIDGVKDRPENDGANGLRNIGLGLSLYRAYETGARVNFTDGVADLPEGYRNLTY